MVFLAAFLERSRLLGIMIVKRYGTGAALRNLLEDTELLTIQLTLLIVQRFGNRQ